MDFKSDLKLQNESDLSTSKHELVTVFITQQTDSMFILTSDLKGYERRDIKIEINEDGSRITVSGEKPNRRRGFQKTFIIPEGVVLNKVKARFDQDESRLTIRMPKSVKGVTGNGIQEVRDALNPGKEATSTQQNHEMRNVDQEIQGSTDSKQDETSQNGTESKQNEVHKIQSENQDFVQEKVEQLEQENNIQEAKPPEKSSITYTPIIVGSTLFASLIVVFFSLIRSKNESNKKTN